MKKKLSIPTDRDMLIYSAASEAIIRARLKIQSNPHTLSLNDIDLILFRAEQDAGLWAIEAAKAKKGTTLSQICDRKFLTNPSKSSRY